MRIDSPIDRLTRALDATGEIVAAVRNDQWSAPTPCPEWNARTLVNHLVAGNRMFAAILRGEPLPPREDRARLSGIDTLGNDPTGAYWEAGAELLAAFSGADMPERVFQAPVGPVSGAVLLHLRITELLVHGWDLARATGQLARLPDDLAAEELAFARSSQAPDVPRTGHPFGPVQTIAGNTPAIDRLAAYLGRPIATGLAEADCV